MSDETGNPVNKVDFISAHCGIIEKNLRSLFKNISDTLQENGVSPHDTDTIILNALGRVTAQTITYIAVLIKSTEEPTSEEVEETTKAVAEDVFEAIQSILSKHSGRPIVHIKKEGDSA